MRRLLTIATTLLLAAPVLAGCSSTSGAEPVAPPSSATSEAPAPSRAQVKAFVDEAVAYADENGKQAALAAFTQPGGQFHDGQLYIFAYDFDGNVIAHGGDPSLVGQNLMDMTDPNGVKVIEELSRIAEGGSGWLEYTWPNPAHGNAEEPKLGYVAKVNDSWFLGSGTYVATPSPSP